MNSVEISKKGWNTSSTGSSGDFGCPKGTALFIETGSTLFTTVDGNTFCATRTRPTSSRTALSISVQIWSFQTLSRPRLPFISYLALLLASLLTKARFIVNLHLRITRLDALSEPGQHNIFLLSTGNNA